MNDYKEQLALTNEAIDSLINLFKRNISHLEVLREHVKDLNEQQLRIFMLPFAIGILPTMSGDAIKSENAIIAAIHTVKDIKGGKFDE